MMTFLEFYCLDFWHFLLWKFWCCESVVLAFSRRVKACYFGFVLGVKLAEVLAIRRYLILDLLCPPTPSMTYGTSKSSPAL